MVADEHLVHSDAPTLQTIAWWNQTLGIRLLIVCLKLGHFALPSTNLSTQNLLSFFASALRFGSLTLVQGTSGDRLRLSRGSASASAHGWAKTHQKAKCHTCSELCAHSLCTHGWLHHNTGTRSQYSKQLFTTLLHRHHPPLHHANQTCMRTKTYNDND